MTSSNLNKPKPVICLTLDLEEDHAGQIFNHFEGLHHPGNAKWVSFLKTNKIPVSVFVQGKLFDTPDKAFIAHLQKELAPDLIEFYLHAYTHEFKLADADVDITSGKLSFERFFGYAPIGYRAPEGRITLEGLKRLQQRGFMFDSSLFPSIVPKPSAYLKSFNFRSHRGKINDFLLEIPVTTLPGPLFPLTLSWIKCVGWSPFRFFLSRRLKKRPFEAMVFDFHLHDLWYLKSTNKLSPFFRCVYARNRKQGFNLFKTFVRFVQSKNIEFKLLSSAYNIKT